MLLPRKSEPIAQKLNKIARSRNESCNLGTILCRTQIVPRIGQENIWRMVEVGHLLRPCKKPKARTKPAQYTLQGIVYQSMGV